MPTGIYKHKKGYKRPPFSKEWRERMSKSKDTGSLNYWAIHKLVSKYKGKAFGCEKCGLKDINRSYEWSSNKFPYTRNLEDYESLCVPCHRKKDGNDKFYKYNRQYKKCILGTQSNDDLRILSILSIFELKQAVDVKNVSWYVR